MAKTSAPGRQEPRTCPGRSTRRLTSTMPHGDPPDQEGTIAPATTGTRPTYVSHPPPPTRLAPPTMARPCCARPIDGGATPVRIMCSSARTKPTTVARSATPRRLLSDVEALTAQPDQEVLPGQLRRCHPDQQLTTRETPVTLFDRPDRRKVCTHRQGAVGYRDVLGGRVDVIVVDCWPPDRREAVLLVCPDHTASRLVRCPRRRTDAQDRRRHAGQRSSVSRSRLHSLRITSITAVGERVGQMRAWPARRRPRRSRRPGGPSR